MKEYLHFVVLALFSLGFFLFGYGGISEEGYGNLLEMGITDEGAAYLIALLAVVVSPILLYFALKTVGLSGWKSMFGGLLLVTMPVAMGNSVAVADPEASLMMLGASAAILAAGLVAQFMKNRRVGLALLLVVAAAAVLVGSGEGGVDYYIGEYSLLLPFSFALLMEGTKERREDKVAPPIFGAVALIFSHPIGAPVLACTSALGLGEMWKEKERPLNLAFMAVYALCLGFSQADPMRSAILGLFGFIVFYMIANMYEVKMRMLAQPAAILLMLVAVLAMAAEISAHSYEGQAVYTPSEETVGMFKWAGGKGSADGPIYGPEGEIEVGIFAYPNAFRFYAGMEPEVLDPLGGEWADYVVFSYDTLDRSAGDTPNLFWYVGTGLANNGETQVAVYRNEEYMLNTVLEGGRVDREDGVLLGIKVIPFTKIKMLDSGLAYDDGKNRVINVLGIEGSILAEGLKKEREYSMPGAFVVNG